MINVPFQDISPEHIQSLVDNAVREGKTIEYKQELPGNRDTDKKEFLADVSAFANASGGDLLLGVAEARDAEGKPTGVPCSVDGLAGINADQEIRRLENIIRDGVEPRIPGVQIRAVEGFSKGAVILIRIPNSWASPHMVTFKASPRFFTRTSAGKSPLDVAEIRAAFVQSEALPEKIRRFREGRLGNILAGETPAILLEGPLTVLHLVPVPAFQNQRQVDLMPFVNAQPYLPPIAGGGGYCRLNIDGFVNSTSHGGTGEPLSGYVQLFRYGVIEAVDACLLGAHEGAQGIIPSVAFERDIIQAVTSYFAAFRGSGLEAPVVVMLSLLNVRGFYMYTGRMARAQHRIDKQHLLIPEIVVEDISEEIPGILRPVFDLVWQACGHRRSLNYDQEGNWTSR